MKYSFISTAMIIIELLGIAFLHVKYLTPIIILALSTFFLTVYELLALAGWRKTISEHFGRDWLFEISDAGIVARWPRGESTVSWGAISTARVHKHSWSFRLLDKRNFQFPRAAFTEEDRVRIDEFIQSGIPASEACGTAAVRQHLGVRCRCESGANSAAARDEE
jgi:hypothetical protein